MRSALFQGSYPPGSQPCHGLMERGLHRNVQALLQASACVVFAHVLLAKASHLAKCAEWNGSTQLWPNEEDPGRSEELGIFFKNSTLLH